MRNLKTLKMVLSLIFIIVTGALFLYDNRARDPVQWQSAESAITETEASFVADENQTMTTDSIETEPVKIYVYVCGQVMKPDVYPMMSDARIYEVIAAAGGATSEADLQQMNLADRLADGQRIYVPAKGESMYNAEDTEDKMSNGLVNINTATTEQLQTLPGIGQAKAKAIVAYREANGNFSSIEDLRNVPGIKEGVFGQVQSLICVD